MQADRPIGAPGRQEAAIGAERNGVDDKVVAKQREFLPPGRSIPELGGAIEAGSGDKRSIWAHSNTHDRAGVPPQRRKLPARLKIPDLRRPVPAACDHLSVGCEREVLKDVGMASELAEPLEGISVPYDKRLVFPAARARDAGRRAVTSEARGVRRGPVGPSGSSAEW